ncbi:MAG: TenA family protein [Gaiellales bacterium]
MSGYGNTFQLWREAAEPAWRDYTHHPFVEGLRDGSLPRKAFLHYLAQDYIYIHHFARAWALWVVKAETTEEMRACVAIVNASISDEMRLHIVTCAAEGLSEADLIDAEEAPETLAYTRYVLDAGHSGDFLDLMAVLAPCVFGYGEIGLRMTREGHAPLYADWIATYAGEDFQNSCREVGALIDGAVARRLGKAPATSPRWPRLARGFATATRLEAAFWEMGLRGA